MFTEMRL